MEEEKKLTFFDYVFNFVTEHLDFYSQPPNLVYKGKGNYKNAFGGVWSILTVMFCCGLLALYMIIPRPLEICPLTKHNAIFPDIVLIDTKQQFFLFFAVRDNYKVIIILTCYY